jgi:signal transduction histidine kinase
MGNVARVTRKNGQAPRCQGARERKTRACGCQTVQGAAAMPDARTRSVESITKAKLELDRALAELDTIRTFDPTLVSVVAHAMSNYITVTTATVEMLQISLRDYTDSDVPIWLEGIAHAANLMQHSIGRLVAVSPPRDFPLKLDYVNVVLLMQRACDYYRRRAEPHHVRILIDTSGTIPLVWADRVALAVIAANLLSNAVHASPPDSTIRVSVVREQGRVIVAIRDAGPGLSKEEQARVLQRPLPADTRPAATPESGYGLAVAREFIHRLEGDLWCQSEPGQGATFLFSLPALDE